MSELTNPINKKLEKMRRFNSQKVNKTSESLSSRQTHLLKSNESKCNQFKMSPNECSARKRDFMSRKKQRKNSSISFFQKQYSRRVRKYEERLLDEEQRQEDAVEKLQEELKSLILIQHGHDEDLHILKNLVRYLENGQIGKKIQLGKLNLQALEKLGNVFERALNEKKKSQKGRVFENDENFIQNEEKSLAQTNIDHSFGRPSYQFSKYLNQLY